MASRRTRIKGIANIPQRRKPLLGNAPADPKEGSKEPINQKELVKNLNLNSNAKDSAEQTAVNSSETKNQIDHVRSHVNSDQEVLLSPQVSPFLTPLNPHEASLSSKNNLPKSYALSKANEDPQNKSNLHNDSTSLQCENDKLINILEITKLPSTSTNELNEFTFKTINSHENRPAPSLSPSKFANRSRIKAIPRLGHQRRISISLGSASESEDESRKTLTNKRVRNDSVCSTISTMTESPAAENANRKRKTEFNTVIQRKCRRTEQSRKLAEARRDFQMKFNDGKPNRQKLTMIDLLFYNPETSPMSQKLKKQRSNTESESIVEDEPETVDDPLPNSTAEADSVNQSKEMSDSDEENLVPAPQIKIGDDGEIIVDEKSLVIENKDLKKDRENLSNSKVLNGDSADNYGVYKRIKRAKDWSKAETLRFYKVLNTIGTDFTLMGEVFPNRSRRELKMKFKKEERINRVLIDRAIMQPVEFDFDELQRELDELDFRKMEEQKLLKEKLKKKREKKSKAKNPKAIAAQSLEKNTELNENLNQLECETNLENDKISKSKKIKSKKHLKKNSNMSEDALVHQKLKNGIRSLLNDEEDSEDEKPLRNFIVKEVENKENGCKTNTFNLVPESASVTITQKNIETCTTNESYPSQLEEMLSDNDAPNSVYTDHNYSRHLPQSDEQKQCIS